jgi:hypothetical protein
LPLDLSDSCVSTIKQLATRNLISSELEIAMATEILNGNANLLAVCKHYRDAPDKLLRILQDSNIAMAFQKPLPPDAIVVGTGLAGLAATLTILDNGGRVVLVEKEMRMGGNSAKASSGINACCPHGDAIEDSKELFKNDTTKSAGEGANPALIDVLVSGSEDAVEWLKSRVNVDLSQGEKTDEVPTFFAQPSSHTPNATLWSPSLSSRSCPARRSLGQED